ncbi:peptidoglycan bridge formation glycyltransferase FemA/FemB family protein [Candidatus Saccharibacteria bacterium]|nr:peptidoglycan bridge formation glycyltransferase FemA/FemB family protein [Candidatus Saccharibacteria bacterium]MBQ6147283.1 peptidoglycan bridge formation glycyltransferase FemA/FemB family protein [Candidatus Saccharibacteria bacterium]
METKTEIWSDLLRKFPESNFLQSPLWAEANRLIGHKIVFENFDDEAMFLGIIKDAKRGRYLEIPGGPLVDWKNKPLVKKIFTRIKVVAKENHCVFVRFRPQLENTPENNLLLSGLDFSEAPMHLHAQDTVLINLEKSEEELLADLRRQTRYEVRRSEKLNLKIEEDHSEAAFKSFHKIQVETAKRQNFVPPDEKTLLAERTAFSPENLKLYVVKTEDEKPVAYGLILIYGNEAAYFEAASTDLNRKLPGAYLLLWTAIKDLKKQEIKRFNLWGIAPPNQPNHRYAGVTTFKTGFGGEIVEYIPAKDLVINPIKYKLNVLVETARKKKRNL